MTATSLNPSDDRVHVFADLSNLIGGARQLARRYRDDAWAVRLEATRLLRTLARGRPIASATAILNAPPGCGAREAFERAGWSVVLVEPGRYTGREQAGDENLQMRIVAALARESRPTLVVATGDGADSEGGLGFISVLSLAVRAGATVEVASWSPTLSQRLRAFAVRHGTCYDLDPAYPSITFVDGGRRVEPQRLPPPYANPTLEAA